MAKTIKKNVPFEEIIAALLDYTRPFAPVYLHRFSDISPADLAKLKKSWEGVTAERRASLFEDLEMLADSDTMLSMDTMARFGLNDSEARVREVSARMLWEVADVKMIPKLIYMMRNDPAEMVRASAASALGMYVYLGEIEEISADAFHTVEKALLDMMAGKDVDIVRRRALESLGYSYHKSVQKYIQKAYNSTNNEWICSALFAMGRSSEEKWIPSVMEMFDHDDDRVKFEAIRAAGELGANTAREPLLKLLGEGIEDEELRMAVIWSLSQIGGEDVRETLENMMEETEDDDEAAFLEEAIDNLFLTEGMDNLDMFDFGVEDEDHLDNVVNLEKGDEQDTEEFNDPDRE